MFLFSPLSLSLSLSLTMLLHRSAYLRYVMPATRQ